MAVAITRRDLSADELRQEAGRSRDANAARRMRALALALEGCSRETAAATCGMDRQTLRDWVHRYNAEGLAGLSNRRAPGPAPRLSAEQEGATGGVALRTDRTRVPDQVSRASVGKLPAKLASGVYRRVRSQTLKRARHRPGREHRRPVRSL